MKNKNKRKTKWLGKAQCGGWGLGLWAFCHKIYSHAEFWWFYGLFMNMGPNYP